MVKNINEEILGKQNHKKAEDTIIIYLKVKT